MIAPFEAALREAARLLGAMALPLLLAILGAGVLVALIQSVTRLRDRSISVVPRLLAVGLVLAAFGGWFASRLSSYAIAMLHAAEAAARAR